MQILEGKSCVVSSTGCPTLAEYLKVRHCAGSGEGVTSGWSQFDGCRAGNDSRTHPGCCRNFKVFPAGVRKSGKAFERRPNNSSLFLILPKAGAACLR